MRWIGWLLACLAGIVVLAVLLMQKERYRKLEARLRGSVELQTAQLTQEKSDLLLNPEKAKAARQETDVARAKLEAELPGLEREVENLQAQLRTRQAALAEASREVVAEAEPAESPAYQRGKQEVAQLREAIAAMQAALGKE